MPLIEEFFEGNVVTMFKARKISNFAWSETVLKISLTIEDRR